MAGQSFEAKCLEHLAYEAEELRQHIQSLQQDCETYREMAQLALAEVNRLTGIVERQQQTIRRVMFGEKPEERVTYQPWYPPAGTPDPPHTMLKASEIRWKLK